MIGNKLLQSFPVIGRDEKVKKELLLIGLCVSLLSLWGCGGSQTANQPPSAAFEYSPGAPQAGDEITFDASTSSDPDGKIARFSWEFPDGSTAQGAKITRKFDQPGSFNVKLTVTDDKQKSHSISKTITVSVRAAADPRAEHLKLSQGTVLRIATTAEPRNLLPNATEGTWEGQIAGLLFGALVQTNNRLEVIPDIATRWDWDEQNLTFTFHLRSGVKFHDGVELTCDDVLFSFKTVIHPQYPGVRFSNFEGIAGAKEYHEGKTAEWPIPGLTCLDKYTFRVKLTSIQRTFLPYAAGSGVLPKHIYEPFFEEQGYDKLQGADLILGKTIGSGPYKLAEWVPGQYVKLERFDGYWQSRETEIEEQVSLGGVVQIYFIVIPDPDTQYAKFLAGEVDVLDTAGTPDRYFELKAKPNVVTYAYSQLVYDYWHWNLRNPLFQDVQVRKAMCFALDRQKMIDQVLRGLGEPASGDAHPLRWDWDPALREIHPSYDPKETIELMEAAGWTIEKDASGNIKPGAVWTKRTPDGKVLKMEFEIATNAGNKRREDYMIIMQQQLAALGFRATLRTLDVNAFYNDYLQGSHKFETAVAGWRLGIDPDKKSTWHSGEWDGFNWQAYSNPEVDRLIEEGLNYMDVERAKPIYQKLNHLIVEDMGYCWLSFQKGTVAAKPGLLGLEPFSPLGWYVNMYSWYWEGKGLPVTVQGSTTH